MFPSWNIKQLFSQAVVGVDMCTSSCWRCVRAASMVHHLCVVLLLHATTGVRGWSWHQEGGLTFGNPSVIKALREALVKAGTPAPHPLPLRVELGGTMACRVSR